ncbi:DUF4176 domain-containing protein [Streptococcus agalactiae]|uniref:DUF4176 domain-containing protein n=1 Tax=Streptococcus agalactiae TaxID=1311 RepID=UPI003F178F9A
MLLPVGSVVYLIDGNQKLVIVNRGAIVEQEGQEVYFDYLGGIFPEGLNLEQVYYFNKEEPVVLVNLKNTIKSLKGLYCECLNKQEVSPNEPLTVYS